MNTIIDISVKKVRFDLLCFAIVMHVAIDGENGAP